MTTTPDPELLVGHLRSLDGDEAVAAVRCLSGPVRLGARFHRILGTGTGAALATLRGTGVHLLRTGDPSAGRQTVLGTDPRRS
ncbi:hypothetical protein LG634_22745 [Streptomyces bambusae]|uniref:hypothetical protein n=1 Tax=Streptomyces bambusae TaxID=1550616 RepID=UPI001CFCE0CD|nr:hypothetical protein [Streptomyces bambusae]MCB5167636.1 hypothetical protein [Streptomyces bambusae]